MSSSEDLNIPDYDEALTLLAKATLPGAQPTPDLSPAPENGEPPPDTRKWNWGAFFGNFLWCKYHGLTPAAWTFLAVAVVGVAVGALAPGLIGLIVGAVCLASLIALSIYLGAYGGAIAWENRRFEGGVDQFGAVQRQWTRYGIAGFGAACAIFAGLLVFDGLGPQGAGAGAQTADSHGAGATSPFGHMSLTANAGAGSGNGAAFVAPTVMKGAAGRPKGSYGTGSLYPVPITPVYEAGHAAPAQTHSSDQPASDQQPDESTQQEPATSTAPESGPDESSAQQPAADMPNSSDAGQSPDQSQSGDSAAAGDSSASSPPATDSTTPSDQPAASN